MPDVKLYMLTWADVVRRTGVTSTATGLGLTYQELATFWQVPVQGLLALNPGATAGQSIPVGKPLYYDCLVPTGAFLIGVICFCTISATQKTALQKYLH